MEFVLLGWPPDGPTVTLDYREFSYAGKFVMSNTGKALAREGRPTGAPRTERAGSEQGERPASREARSASEGASGETASRGDERSKSPGRAEDGDTDSGPPVTEDGDAAADVVAAAAFNGDRTDAGTCWIRYITVRRGRRGDGIGPRLAAFVADRAEERGYDRARIAVNNPFAYQALYRAGFAFTGEETGVAELVLDRPLGDDAAAAARSRATYQAGLDCYRARVDDPDAPDLAPEERTFLDEKQEVGPPDPTDAPE